MGDAQGEAKAAGQISSRLVTRPAFTFFFWGFNLGIQFFTNIPQESIRCHSVELDDEGRQTSHKTESKKFTTNEIRSRMCKLLNRHNGVFPPVDCLVLNGTGTYTSTVNSTFSCILTTRPSFPTPGGETACAAILRNEPHEPRERMRVSKGREQRRMSQTSDDDQKKQRKRANKRWTSLGR